MLFSVTHRREVGREEFFANAAILFRLWNYAKIFFNGCQRHSLSRVLVSTVPVVMIRRIEILFAK